MKDKIHNFNETFKEYWAVPRYKALIKLGLYFLFFLVFGLIFSLNKVPRKQIQETPKKDPTIYTYTINESNIEYNIKTNLFKYNNEIYKVKNNEITCEEECEFDIPYFILFTPNRINRYLENSEPISKTEYKNGDIEYKYEIKDTEVNSYFDVEKEFYIISKNDTFIIDLDNYNMSKILVEYK